MGTKNLRKKVLLVLQIPGTRQIPGTLYSFSPPEKLGTGAV